MLVRSRHAARPIALLSVAFASLAACGSDDVVPKPDPSASSATSSGQGGSSSASGSGGSSTSSAAGGSDGRPAGYISGSRLRARYLEGEDGSRQYVGWRDNLLDADCSFGADANGTTRCFPSGIEPLPTTRYLDANCTQPLDTYLPTCSEPPKYRYVYQADACGAQHVLEAYEVSYPAGPAYLQSGGACFSTNDMPVLIGNAVPLSTFVAASSQVE